MGTLTGTIRGASPTEPLLATKLRLPPPAPRQIARPRLTAQLQEALERPLTLVAAPAGFGKTTMLTAWLHDADVPAAWVSLDGGDDDPARFWSYAFAALDGVRTSWDLRAVALPLLHAPQPPPVESILTEVLNRLADADADIVLVFDDYHAITPHPSMPRWPSCSITCRRACTSSSPPGPTRPCRSPGYARAASWPRSAPRTYASPGRKRPPSSPGWARPRSRRRRSLPSTRAPRAGPPGCSWRRWRYTAAGMSRPSWRGSPARTASSWIT